jgi:hypothetical protein
MQILTIDFYDEATKQRATHKIEGEMIRCKYNSIIKKLHNVSDDPADSIVDGTIRIKHIAMVKDDEGYSCEP